ncbi:MAG: ASKHA domain-containing protein [Dehalococcoidales bacterium]|nr:ASKHA domain-containing protein [Dehalococcoidales bacterium]
MANSKKKVHFAPDNVNITVEQGANLLETAVKAGVRLIAACGGAGVCGKCKVLIEEGEVESTRTDKLSDEEYARGFRQACKSRVITDLKVSVPVESRLETAIITRERKVMTSSTQQIEALAAGWRFNPPLKKFFVELPPPTLTDNVSDLSRVLRGLKQQYKLRNITVDFDVVKKLPKMLRDSDWKVTVTTLVTAVESRSNNERRPRLINVERGDTTQRLYSLALDIGTTTVKGQLLDLNKGRAIAEKVEYNGQISYGADVISRIAYCQKPGGLSKLQKAVIITINGIIKQLLSQSRVAMKDIGNVAVAGNTTMLQILFGINPQYIRLSPYTPAATYIPPVKASSLGIKVGRHVYLLAFPLVASYIGGDIIAGIIASGVHQREKLTYYMDIGTNGQIVIGNSNWMVTAACSAGPAFEGGEIKHGMIATNGAIEEFDINSSNLEPTVGTIGGEKPKGICGSGLINIVAGLLEVGVIGQNGKFVAGLPTKRIRGGIDGYEYVLTWAPDTQIGKDIVITTIDIDNLMRAKAAMYAGCQTLVKGVGMTCNDIEEVIIAGAFGSYINIERAITIGLLPDLPRDKFIFIGNGSLMGARLGSFSIDLLDDARAVAKVMTNFELSENTDFMSNYIAALFLPHTNADEFPSVSKRLSNLVNSQLKQRRTL